MNQIVLANVTLDYPAPAGTSVRALERVSLLVQSGEFVSLVGPSGCGKSTILKLVSGLLTPTSGNVLLAGRPVSGVPAGIGFMFQQDALLPWATALENVTVALELRGLSRSAREPRARELLDLVGLTGFEQASSADPDQDPVLLRDYRTTRWNAGLLSGERRSAGRARRKIGAELGQAQYVSTARRRP